MHALCPFCERIAKGEFHIADADAVAFPDGFPVSPGHYLIVPRRHEADFFQLTPNEQVALLWMARAVKERLQGELNPAGFNLGVNVGAAGGQTVNHVHLHVIPRYEGDVPEPRGGVRWILPQKAAYWVDHA